ncbi:MAG: glutamate--cysteine ligase [Thermoleophilia bacterium]|nr:glutamate--cysteine ligase [Thermoleophilia bacterium]
MPDAISFASSEPLTLGIEEELLVVEASAGWAPAPVADQLLDGAWDTVAVPGGWLKPEMLRSSIELNTAACDRLEQLDVDLRAVRAAAVERARAAGVRLAAIGMHPDLVVRADMVSPNASHQTIAELHARVGTLGEQSIHGIHVHVGMPDLAAALRVTDALAAWVPLLIACTAHSPVARGVRAPWRSARAEVTRRMLWAGPTPRFSGMDEYASVHALHQLENSGDQRFLWEVAPVPSIGTVEVRVFDAHPDVEVALGMAALLQALAAHVLDGGPVARANESLERHNRWSAMEFGPRARFLVPGRGAPVDAVELARDLVELARPYARDLGGEPWLAVVERLLVDPPVERAITAFEDGGLDSLLAHAEVR